MLHVDFNTKTAVGPLYGCKPGSTGEHESVLLAPKRTVRFRQDGFGIRGRIRYQNRSYDVIDATVDYGGVEVKCLWLCQETKDPS